MNAPNEMCDEADLWGVSMNFSIDALTTLLAFNHPSIKCFWMYTSCPKYGQVLPTIHSLILSTSLMIQASQQNTSIRL